MKTIQLEKYKVEVRDQLTWGMQEQIREAMLGGIRIGGMSDKEKQNLELDTSVLTKAKYKALEICVTKITDETGKVIEYSKDWMDNLSIEDGDKLYEAVNEITSPAKKL